MDTSLFSRYASTIRSLSASDIDDVRTLRSLMRIEEHGPLDICYAPFEHINSRAKLVIVGITPGYTQMGNALEMARQALLAGDDHATVLRKAKEYGAFSGDMRGNLISLLNHVGIPKALGILDAAELFGSRRDLVHTTSILRNPVFFKGANYNGNPSMIANPVLRRQMVEGFAKEMQSLPGALIVPLGDKVSKGLDFLAKAGYIDPGKVLSGLPHPSPLNIERINCFLGKVREGGPSNRTNLGKIESAREGLRAKILALH